VLPGDFECLRWADREQGEEGPVDVRVATRQPPRPRRRPVIAVSRLALDAPGRTVVDRAVHRSVK